MDDRIIELVIVAAIIAVVVVGGLFLFHAITNIIRSFCSLFDRRKRDSHFPTDRRRKRSK